jgi:predicted DNA-binding protein
MSKKMKITIEIEDEHGATLAKRTSEREVPYVEELIEKGFRGAFHDLEVAVLESRKEVSDGIVGDYLEIVSKKKPKLKREIEEVLREKGTL